MSFFSKIKSTFFEEVDENEEIETKKKKHQLKLLNQEKTKRQKT